MQLGRMNGQRQVDASNKGDIVFILTSCKEHMSPKHVPWLYMLYTNYFGNPGEFELPINLCEQQHKRPGQFESGLMVMVQATVEKSVAQYDAEQTANKGVVRETLSKQRKLLMKNNGQHGTNPERKVKSEEVGTMYCKLCGCEKFIDALLEYKHAPLQPGEAKHEIDDIFDALNLALATGVEMVSNEAKFRDPKCMPLQTGACLDGGKTFVRFHSSDPGEVLHSRVIVDVSGRLYPPRQGLTLYYNDTENGKDMKGNELDDPSKDVLMPLPAFRPLLAELINLRTNKTLFRWEVKDPEKEPFYKPTQRDLLVMIKEAEEARKERIRLNRAQGAKRAAETRKRKKLDLELADVIEIKDDEGDGEELDVVERARKRTKLEDREDDVIIL